MQTFSVCRRTETTMTDRAATVLSGTFAVIGFGTTGEAVARAVIANGGDVVAIEDEHDETKRMRALAIGCELHIAPDIDELRRLVSACQFVVVSPGVAPSHAIFRVGAKGQIISEIELAYRIATVPVIAITGTNGKTTVTSLVDAMLTQSGRRSTAAGNIGPTLIEASLRDDLEVIVAEVSSFQLAYTSTFRPRVATFLNFAEDHLDWHRSVGEYLAAKARIFANLEAGDVAVVNGSDPLIVGVVEHLSARVVTFGRSRGDYHLENDRFIGPGGADLGGIEVLSRTFSHDIENALAAIATALEAGATISGCLLALKAATGLPHRVEHVADLATVAFYDDSKATTPSAVTAALSAFSSTVLIVGGRNKGLDLSVLGDFARAHPEHQIRAVVAIGDATEELLDLFAPICPVIGARSMDEAVEGAYLFAEDGDVVLLSPGCASFDWYRSYAERGDDFQRAVFAFSKRHGSSAGMSEVR